MWPIPQETADLVTFTEETLNDTYEDYDCHYSGYHNKLMSLFGQLII